MQRLLLGLAVITGLGAAVAISGGRRLTTSFEREERNPVTHLRWNEGPEDFQFAIVSDRTGGHRANVFAQAVAKLNLLQPAFVVSVGDLIEGSKKDETLTAEWTEFDGYLKHLSMPFFYVAGNHDVGSKESAKFWQEKLGRRYYHFVYRNVLFLMLNSDDPPGANGSIGREQIEWARGVLEDNREARWTIVVVHRPLWVANDGVKNGWQDVEKALAGRNATVFAGHVHRFQKWVRGGQNYYQLATTGGSSLMRGVEQGEFDHITWITMKPDGPRLAHVTLDAIHAEDMKPFLTDEPGLKRTRLPTYPVAGQAFFDGTPMPGAIVLLTPKGKGARAVGVVQPDGSFMLSSYAANDGAAAGEYDVTVGWREKLRDGTPGPSLLPERYGKTATSGLKATIAAGKNDLVLELTK